MNIFILDDDPKQAAQWLCDKHICKMIVESAQMLCSAYPEKYKAPYKATYINHPCTKWTRSSRLNFNWLVDHAHELCWQYSERYGKIHKSEKVIHWGWINSHKLTIIMKNLVSQSGNVATKIFLSGTRTNINLN